MSADQACSLPFRHARMRRASLHVTSGPRSRRARRVLARLIAAHRVASRARTAPRRSRARDGRESSAGSCPVPSSRRRARSGLTRLMMGRFCATSSCTRSYRRLRSWTSRVVSCRRINVSISASQAVAGSRLSQVPEVGVAARQPDVHLAVGIPIAAAQAEHARVVVVRRQEPVEEGAQLERHDTRRASRAASGRPE